MKLKITLFLVCFFTLPLSAHLTENIKKTIIHVVKGDIVSCSYEKHGNYRSFKADAIVNAANKKLARGGGVCGAIFAAAEDHGTILQKYIRKHHPKGIATGQAIDTPSFNLQKAGIKKIIHAVGPIYCEYKDKDEAKKHLRNAYKNSLLCAQSNNFSSIAFPFISSGIYGYPKREAAHLALESIKKFITHQNQKCTLTDIYIVLNNDIDYDFFASLLQ